MTGQTHLDPTSIIIFGGTGDLAKRKLFPAFYNLFLEGKMPTEFRIVALGRGEKTNEDFRTYIKENIELFSRNKISSETIWNEFQEKIVYLRTQIEEQQSYLDLAKTIDSFDVGYKKRSNRLYYLSIAPNFIESVTKHIKSTSLANDPDKDRIIVEKPFGHDKKSAIELNNLLSKTFEEKQLYRIDHYLGKETVQNILTFRFGNAIFEPLWSNQHIESIQITVAEEVGVESRGGFYEGTGALKDMIQNHLMQVLCMIAMEVPASLDANEIRDKKVNVLKRIRRITDEQVAHYAVRGQYAKGEINEKEVVAYREEPGVDPNSTTETFAALKFYIDNERWQGVPFYMRTGKRLQEKQSYIIINFKPISNHTFSSSEIPISPNRLIINIQPTMDIRLQFMTKKPGISMSLKPAEMVFDDFSCKESTPEAYETLLMDAILGDLTLFMRSDLVEEAWDVVDVIRRNWEENKTVNFPNYASGSWGPKEAELLVERQGHVWSSIIKQ